MFKYKKKNLSQFFSPTFYFTAHFPEQHLWLLLLRCPFKRPSVKVCLCLEARGSTCQVLMMMEQVPVFSVSVCVTVYEARHQSERAEGWRKSISPCLAAHHCIHSYHHHSSSGVTVVCVLCGWVAVTLLMTPLGWQRSRSKAWEFAATALENQVGEKTVASEMCVCFCVTVSTGTVCSLKCLSWAVEEGAVSGGSSNGWEVLCWCVFHVTALLCVSVVASHTPSQRQNFVEHWNNPFYSRL